MSDKYRRLKQLLLELFQLDKPDLDFGIYRIMHARQEEVTQFLDRDLLPQVKAALAGYEQGNRSDIQSTLDKLLANLIDAGVDPEQSPKVTDLRQQLAEAGGADAVEGEVYDLITRFFARYYSDGDFISQRRYSSDSTYAIPYNGEEVVLHWANKDQYYIKTSEYLRDFSFRLNVHDDANPMRVHFRLVDADEGEHGNAKAAEGKGRVFVLASGGDTGTDFAELVDGELTLRFEYRPVTQADWPADRRTAQAKPPRQTDISAIAEQAVLALKGEPWSEWTVAMASRHIKADGSQSDHRRLRVQMDRYTAKNTFDYFIHKDLGGFLRHELDFFIKNEVMQLDDIENASAPKVEQYLAKLRAIRQVATKIIDFLAQLEDFQKKLWLKKKFVVDTTYFVAMGSVDERFHAEICASEPQRQEWVELFAIDSQAGDLIAPGFSNPLTLGFLKANPTLTLNTDLFDEAFKTRLVESMGEVDDLDSKVDGLLVHSETFQALALLSQLLRHSIDFVYADPPYNTGKDGFTYRDELQHSSWASMVADRLAVVASLIADDGAIVVSIDDREALALRWIMELVFGKKSMVAELAVVNNWKGRQDRAHIATAHERALYFAGEAHDSNGLALSDWQVAEYDQTDDDGLRYTFRDLRKRGGADTRERRPNMYFPIFWDDATATASMVSHTESAIPIYPTKSDGSEGCWRWGYDAVAKRVEELAASAVASSGRWNVNYRVYLDLDDETRTSKPKSVWAGAKYSTDSGIKALRAVIPNTQFSSPKAVGFITDLVAHASTGEGAILDPYFGSGTTAVAVMGLNRTEPARRNWVGIEVTDELYATAVPRIRRLLFSPEWADGRPQRAATAQEADRSPRLIKVLRLESYEDALNNLDLRRTEAQQTLIASADEVFREKYVLRYMLDVESRGSASLLDFGAFDDPAAYKLRVKPGGSDESRLTNVDLIETFNYLLGLIVESISAPRRFLAVTERDSRDRLQVKSFRQAEDGGHWFRAVTGTNPEGQRVLVVWRNRPGSSSAEGIEQDNTVLNYWFTNKQQYSVREPEFAIVYVNGDNNLENLRRDDETWKVRLIEEHFQRLMFDTDGMP